MMSLSRLGNMADKVLVELEMHIQVGRRELTLQRPCALRAGFFALRQLQRLPAGLLLLEHQAQQVEDLGLALVEVP